MKQRGCLGTRQLDSSKLPAEFGAGAGNVVGVVEEAVHGVETQQVGVRDWELVPSADAVLVPRCVADVRVAIHL